MAVAEKKAPETSVAKPMPIPVAGLLGAVWIAMMVAVAFSALPWAWYKAVTQLGLTGNAFASNFLLGVVGIGVLVGLGYVGYRLMGGKDSRPGLRASIFVSFAGILFLVLICRSIAGWIESSVYDGMLKSVGSEGGMGLAIGITTLLFWFFGRTYFRESFQKKMVKFESHGWFTSKPYKGGQGLRVRRGTFLGILIICGTGLWVLMDSGRIGKGPWTVSVPFTAKSNVTNPGDVEYLSPEQQQALGLSSELLARLKQQKEKLAEEAANTKLLPGQKKPKSTVPPIQMDQNLVRKINAELDPATHHLVQNAEAGVFLRYQDKLDKKYQLQDSSIITKDRFQEVVRRIQKQAKDTGDNVKDVADEAEAAAPPTKPMQFTTFYAASFTLLPNVQYAVPLLLLGLAFWMAWRIVNLPVFGDFLLSTEAEVNKVSWTSRRDLYKDTIVVLVTVFMMAVFLSVADYVWYKVLSWKPIGVLKVPDEKKQKLEESKW